MSELWQFRYFILMSSMCLMSSRVFYLCWIYWSSNCFSLWTLRTLSSTLLLLAQSTRQQRSENAVVFHREEFFPIISSDGEAEGDIGTVMRGWQWGKNTSPHLKAPLGLTEEPKQRKKRESFAPWKRLAFSDLEFSLSISIWGIFL